MPENDVPFCPSCGRSLPAEAKACRFCGASLRTRISTSYLAWGALLLFVIAVIHFTAALRYQPRFTAIGDLNAEMNFERVRVAGRVVNVSVTRDKYNAPLVRMELEDPATADTAVRQRISVRLEGEGAQDFMALQDPPRRGDVLEVAGSLFAGSSYRYISMESPKLMKIKARPAGASLEGGGDTPATVAELLSDPARFSNRWVKVDMAEVADFATATPLVRIREPGQTNSLVVFGFDGGGLSVGQKVTVRGQFVFYSKMGYWEIKTARGDPRAIAPAGTPGGD